MLIHIYAFRIGRKLLEQLRKNYSCDTAKHTADSADLRDSHAPHEISYVGIVTGKDCNNSECGSQSHRTQKQK